MIRKLTGLEAFAELCRTSKSWGLYLSFNEHAQFSADGPSAAPYLTMEDDAQALIDGELFILCSTEVEMIDLFDQTVGDDGPTATNAYDGEARAYALTCSPDGVLLNENT